MDSGDRDGQQDRKVWDDDDLAWCSHCTCGRVIGAWTRLRQQLLTESDEIDVVVLKQ